MPQIQDYKDLIRLESIPHPKEENEKYQNSSFEDLSDLKLWQEFKKGSRAAFIFIYNKNFDRLFNYAHHFTGDSDLVKDCIQDLFVELSHSKARLGETSCIHLYLYKALKRKILRASKKQMRMVHNLDGAKCGFIIDLSIEQKIINRQLADEQIEKLRSSVNSLTHRQREAIFYFYYEGFSLDQVKELMEMQSPKATQNLIYKAIKELRKLLTFIITLLSFLT